MDEQMNNDPQFDEAQLARLADGSLPPERQAEFRDQSARSPALARALAEQEHAVGVLRAVDPPAPDSLRQWLDDQTRQAPARARLPAWLSPRIAFPAAAALAAVVAAVIVIASSAGSNSSFSQATRATLAPATQPAPSKGGAMTLDVSAGGIPFPYWEQTVGWHAWGMRSDTIAGHKSVTVFYSSPRGLRVGYTIVTGPPVPVSGGSTVTSHGVPYTFVRTGSARLVTWVRQGHTCIIAGRRLSNAVLLKLATADLPE